RASMAKNSNKLAVVILAGLGILGAIVVSQFPAGPKASLAIVSGSENKALEPIVMEWAADNGVDVSMSYLGSVDISRELGQGTETVYDAVWPAHSLWIELGDSQKVTKHRDSILRSPVVLGLRKSIAQRLGWVGRDDITLDDIQAAARDGEFRLSMTSATQSNSGASAYFGFLYARAGEPDVLTSDHLNDSQVRSDVSDLLRLVDRSSGSSGWLKDSVVENPAAFDGMINYEALIIEANQLLKRTGGEPLYVVYPASGMAVADSPLAYVSKGDGAKEEAFLALQQHLLSSDVQEQLLELGRRAGLIGLAGGGSQDVWNPDWGIDLNRAIAPIPTPTSAVIREALTLYQTELRKPSLTVWVLDVSGSMEGDPISQLKQAMRLLLDPEAAALNLLQPSSKDVTIVIPFNGRVEQRWMIEGNDPAQLATLQRNVDRLQAGGGTDLYFALGQALEMLDGYHRQGTLFDHLPAIIAMTDGASDETNKTPLREYIDSLAFGRDIPIHSIAFGQADETQLRELSDASIGRMFKAKGDLANALRKAKGYN
ncbi:MAG: substrate-binding domain-containing protein, partial [Pseudomonadota bacterium]